MSEEEIIKNVKQTIGEYEEVIQEEQEKGNVEDVESGIETKNAIQGLLDLYYEEKDKNITSGNYMKEHLIPKSTVNYLYIPKSKLEDYKKELEETKKHLNSNCNIALMDFGIDLINHILEGENK